MKAKGKALRPQPQRTCIICRRTQDKRGLIRIVRTATQGVLVDERGKAPGRGAYLCHDVECWQRALQGTALAQALKTSLTDQAREQLEVFIATRVLPTAARTSSREP